MNSIEIMAAAFADELEKLASIKEAGVFSNVMARLGRNRGVQATVAKVAPKAEQAVAQTAQKATNTAAENPSMLRRAAPYLAAAGAGAIGFQQLRKASKDWETGRAMRLQQEAYSPT